MSSGSVSVSHNSLLFSRSSDQDRDQDGGSYKSEKEYEGAVEGVRPVIESSCDDGRERCKQGICRDDGKVDRIPCPSVKVRHKGRAGRTESPVGKSSHRESDDDQREKSGMEGIQHQQRG